MKKVYNIPVTFQMWGVEHIEADSLQEAVNIAEGGSRPLPADRGYIEDSYRLDSETAIWEANDVDSAIVDVGEGGVVEELAQRKKYGNEPARWNPKLTHLTTDELRTFLKEFCELSDGEIDAIGDEEE